MAKSKKKEGKGGGLLLLIILLLGLILIATPIAAGLGVLIMLIPYLRKRFKVKGGKSSFWLNNAEKYKFIESVEELKKAIDNINKTNQIGDSEGIARNKDGTLSLRGNRGKELQSIINENTYSRNQNNQIFQYLRLLPQKRWREFQQVYSRFYSFLIAAIAWFAAIYYLIGQVFEDFKTGFDLILRYPKDLLSFLLSMFFGAEPAENPDFMFQWKTLGIAAVICIIIYFIARLITKLTVKIIAPLPPEVNMENVDKY